MDFTDIKIISDNEIKNIQSITIKCCSNEELIELQKILHLGKRKAIHFEDFKEVLGFE